jgi:hypothetical protein
MSTFESDNIDEMFPWLQLIAAKLTSGSVTGVSMVVRVFDPDDMIEVLGPKGCTSIPHKEIYTFRFNQSGTVELDARDNGDAATGQPTPWRRE